MKIHYLAITLLLSACSATKQQQFVGPNGKTAYSMRCSGIERCYKKAGEICPSGYTIVDRASGTVAVPVNGGIMAAPQHNLAIECK